MGYKQKSFPMHKGTSSHKSALKQGIPTDKSYINIDKLVDKDTEEGKITKKDLEAIKLAPNPSDRFDESSTDKLETVTVPEYESKSLKQTEKDAKKAFKREGRKTRKAERKTKKRESAWDRSNETLAERKKRRKKNRESLYEDLDPIFRAMDQPRSTEAKGYFEEEYEKEKRSKKQKRKKKERKETIVAQGQQLKELDTKYKNLYAYVTAANPNLLSKFEGEKSE